MDSSSGNIYWNIIRKVARVVCRLVSNKLSCIVASTKSILSIVQMFHMLLPYISLLSILVESLLPLSNLLSCLCVCETTFAVHKIAYKEPKSFGLCIKELMTCVNQKSILGKAVEQRTDVRKTEIFNARDESYSFLGRFLWSRFFWMTSHFFFAHGQETLQKILGLLQEMHPYIVQDFVVFPDRIFCF